MNSIGNSIIVKIEKEMEDTVAFNGGELIIDPMFRPQWNTRIYGKVVATNSNEKFYQAEWNDPSSKMKIADEIKVGDLVYFNYKAVDNKAFQLDDKMVSVPYDWVFCYVRDGKLTPTSGWILADILYDEGESIVDVDGHSIECSVKGDLVVSIHKKKRTDISKVKYVSEFIDNPSSLKFGDIVKMENGCNFENDIEGKTYYLFREENVVAVI